jgi:hypothetical protein
MKRKMYWFVEPCDSHTNEIIANNLAALNQVNENLALTDADGLPHSVFQVESHLFITRLYKDKQKFSLRFNIFYRQRKSSPLYPWKFEEDKSRRKYQKLRMPKVKN